jgi:hypothetical protein
VLFRSEIPRKKAGLNRFQIQQPQAIMHWEFFCPMKKALLFFGLLAGLITAHAQCPTITGPTSMLVGQAYTFSVNAGSAQCTDCYDWDATASLMSIPGSDQNNTVTINANSAGSGTVCVNYITETGCVSCCINVVITDPCAFTPNFSLTKVSPNSYWLGATPNNVLYTYTWTVTYWDGTVLTFSGRNVYGVEICHNGSGLHTVTLTITSADCPTGKSKTTTYDYPVNCVARAGVTPNPVGHLLHILVPENAKFNGSIRDIDGNVVKTFNDKDGLTVNVSGLKKAIYIVKLVDENGKEISTDKIVKE